MFEINLTKRAEEKFLESTKENPKILGLWLREVNQQPKIDFTTKFHNQVHVCGDSLEVAVTTWPKSLHRFNNSLIDYNGSDFVLI